MSNTPSKIKSVAAYSLNAWEHVSPVTRLVAPWRQAGITLHLASRWDQVTQDELAHCDVVHIQGDFPRLAKSYRQIVDQARQLGKPVLYDLDELLLDVPANHPDRQFHYNSDALFPILQAIVEADAVTVSTPALHKIVRPLNPQTWLLPTCLDDHLWTLKSIDTRHNHLPLTIGWVYDRPDLGDQNGFIAALTSFLHGRGDSALLRVWGCKPPDALLAMPNLDWQADIPLDYSQFSAWMSSQDCDLYVTPQSDQPIYYRSQSPLRYFEQTACGAPGIYSRTPPYEEVIGHQQTGWLASTRDEWLTALNHLADSAELRRQIVLAAQASISQNWLLSQNAHRWLDAFNQASDAAAAHADNTPFVEQVTQLTAQVRDWQRSLEKQIMDRDWEVRALNVMMKRRDREASEYIEQLGAQLEEIWRDPAWRLLHKAQRLAQMVTSPGRRGASAASQPVGSSATDTSSQPAELATTSPTPDLTASFAIVGSAGAYDVLFFSRSGWNKSPESLRELLSQFVHHGSRLFVVSANATAPSHPAIQQIQERVFSLSLPPDGGEGGYSTGTETREFFEQLRVHAGIHAAVCWIDEPLNTPLPYILRNNFGWKIVSNRQPKDTISNLRHDLQINDPTTSGHFTEIQASIQNLFPKVSLIILTYNNLDYTRQCLESIFNKTIYPNYEVVIVDNASTDGTPNYLRTVASLHANARLVLNNENRGFSAGNNQGVSTAHGEYVLFLNNDVVVTPGWLSGLLNHLQDPSVGAVGPVTNYAGNESRITVGYHHITDLDDFARRYTQAHAGQSFEIRMLALFCMLLRRSVIDAVGPLDEQFGVGMYEDDDFSLRIRQKGYRILCAEDVYIHHWGSAAFSQLAQERFERLHLENRRKFESKWGTNWQPPRWRMEED